MALRSIDGACQCAAQSNAAKPSGKALDERLARQQARAAWRLDGVPDKTGIAAFGIASCFIMFHSILKCQSWLRKACEADFKAVCRPAIANEHSCQPKSAPALSLSEA